MTDTRPPGDRGPVTRTLVRMLRQPLEDARAYRLSFLRRDALAGLTVSVLAVPQSLAYAVIAGVPPEVGVTTLIVQSVIGSLLSSQPLLSWGPTNTQSLLVAAVATRVLHSTAMPHGMDPATFYLQLVVGLTFLKGALQMAFALGGLATLVRYVSSSVILGFTSGAGILIAVGQLAPFLGIDLPAGGASASFLLTPLAALASHLAEAQPPSIAIGVGSLAVVLAARAVSPLVPGPLIAVVLGSMTAAYLGWTNAELPRVESIPAHLPVPQLPSLAFERAEDMLGGAFALAVVGLMEAWSIGKTIAARTGQHLSAGQELFAHGFTNAASSLLGAIPGSGSLSRSVLNFRTGAATRYAGVWNGLFAAAMLLLLAPLAAWIPRASLSAVLLVIAWDLVDFRGIARMLRVSRSDASVCLVTLAATLTIPLAYAVFTGVLLNIGLYLRRASRLHLAEMISDPNDPAAGRFIERPLTRQRDERPVVFLQLQGNLFFGQADELAERLADLNQQPDQVVVVRLKRTLSIDSTVLATLDQFARGLKHRGGHLILCGVRPNVTRSLRAYGIIEQIGEENLFEATPGVFASAERALARAQELTGRELQAGDWASDPDE